MEVNVNTMSVPAAWVIKLKERWAPPDPEEGGVQMGRSSPLQGLGPSRDHPQVISLTHFTGR